METFLYKPEIGDSVARDAVVDLLRSELKEFLYEDRTYAATYAIFGGLGNGSSIYDVLKNLIKVAIVETPQSAAKAFYDELTRGYLPYQELFLLTGINVENEVEVFDGISLIPLSNRGDELPGYLPVHLGSDSTKFMSKTLLRIHMSVFPVLHKPEQNYTFESMPDGHFNIAVRSVQQPNFHPGKFFQALTLVGENPVFGCRTVDSYV